MRISSINVDKAIETAKVGIENIKTGTLPKEDFLNSVENLVRHEAVTYRR